MLWMTPSDCKRLATPSDLTETSLDCALSMLGSDATAPVSLIVRVSMALDAGYALGMLGQPRVSAVFLPDEMLPDPDAWAVTDGITLIWSPGA